MASNKPDILLLGDSNVGRYLGRLGLQVTNQVQYFQSRSMEEVKKGLDQVNSSFRFVIFAFVTNLLVAAGESASNSVDRSPALEEMLIELVQKLRFVYMH